MASLATEFNQDNLVEITKLEYHFLEEAIKKSAFLSLTKGDTYKGCKKHTLRYIDEPRKYLTVSHYVSKEGNGLTVSCKADKQLFEAYKVKFKK